LSLLLLLLLSFETKNKKKKLPNKTFVGLKRHNIGPIKGEWEINFNGVWVHEGSIW
jgi:hypothetical protein